MELASVVLVSGVCISLMFKETWMFLGRIFMWFVVALKWIIIGGLIFGLLNCPQMFKTLGWTPLSLLMGKEIYQKAK